MTDLASLKFLVVDDVPSMREVVCISLSKLGYDSEGAADGRIALDMLQTAKFDFVITDVNMPNMDGFELLKAIRADDDLKHLPVLMMTAGTDPADLRRASEGAASGYMTKSFTKATLEDRITRILQRLPSR